MIPVLETDRAAVIFGESERLGELLGPESVEAVVTDPPAGIDFMGKEWDSDRGGRAAWVAWLGMILAQAFRVLKPGGYAVVWAIPRTSHWTATALEDAGFEIRDRIHDIAAADFALANFLASLDEQQRDALGRIIDGQSSPILSHLFGQGFPKSMNLGKAIDEKLGATREVIRVRGTKAAGLVDGGYTSRIADVETAPATELAAQWEGWGTALGPACEHWIVARKPFPGTLVSNVLVHGTGGLNIDGCRTPFIGDDTTSSAASAGAGGGRTNANVNAPAYGKGLGGVVAPPHELGRWPKHITLTHSLYCLASRDQVEAMANALAESGNVTEARDVLDVVGTCVPECPLYQVDEQVGKTAKGGPSRFFYAPKVSRKEREYGCNGLPVKTAGDMTDREDGSAGLKSPRAGAGRTGGARNFHPTLKSIELMRWLVRLVCPRGGTVLDMFAGSGTTGIAALMEGCKFVGFEKDPNYIPITRARVAQALADTEP